MRKGARLLIVVVCVEDQSEFCVTRKCIYHADAFVLTCSASLLQLTIGNSFFLPTPMIVECGIAF